METRTGDEHKVRSMSVAIAKVNVDPSLFDPRGRGAKALMDLFAKPIRALVVTERGGRDYTWVIEDNVIIDSEVGLVAAGRLGRISQRTAPGFDLEAFERIRTVIPNAYEYANFVLAFDSELVVFEERTALSQSSFREAFANICMSADPSLGYVSLYPKTDEAAFECAIRRLGKIHQVMVDFVRPNPMNTDPVVEELYDRLLKQPNSDHTVLTMESRSAGLSTDSMPVLAARKIVGTGYGSSIFTGEPVNGVSVKVRSDDNLIKRTVQASDNVETFVQKFVKVIISVDADQGV